MEPLILIGLLMAGVPQGDHFEPLFFKIFFIDGRGSQGRIS